MRGEKGGTFFAIFVSTFLVLMAAGIIFAILSEKAEKERNAQIKLEKQEHERNIKNKIMRMERSFRSIIQGSGFKFVDVNLRDEGGFMHFYFSFWKPMGKDELVQTIGACIGLVGEKSKDPAWKWGRVYFRTGDAYVGEKIGWITSDKCREALKQVSNPEKAGKIILENLNEWID